MEVTSNYCQCQTAFSPIFPTNPDPPIASVGDIPTQYLAIDAYLAIPNPIREKDRDLVWRICCGVVERLKEVAS